MRILAAVHPDDDVGAQVATMLSDPDAANVDAAFHDTDAGATDGGMRDAALRVPDTLLVRAPAALTSESEALFELACTTPPCTFRCRLDGAGATTCPSTHRQVVAPGSHAFAAVAVSSDGVADPTPATHAWTLDTEAPDTRLAAQLDDIDPWTLIVTLTCTEEPCAFACSLDDKPVACVEQLYMAGGLTAGPHSLRAVATDAAGNADPSPALVQLDAPWRHFTTAGGMPAGNTGAAVPVMVTGDFDADGREDLALAPGDDRAWIARGSDAGLLPPVLALQGVAGMDFGTAMVSGDFNGDGIADVAVGAPLEDGATFRHGAVRVWWGGGDGGLSADPVVLVPFSAGTAEERFGQALAAGDVNGDGITDLVVGAPGADRSGAVYVFRGMETGLRAVQRVKQGLFGAADEPGDLFGTSVAVGDFDDDGFADPAVGAPGEHAGTSVGAVFMAWGHPVSLQAGIFHSFSDSLNSSLFSAVLAAVDVDGDGRAEVAATGGRDGNAAPSVTLLHAQRAGTVVGTLVPLPGPPAGALGAGRARCDAPASLLVGIPQWRGVSTSIPGALAVSAPDMNGETGWLLAAEGWQAGLGSVLSATGFGAVTLDATGGGTPQLVVLGQDQTGSWALTAGQLGPRCAAEPPPPAGPRTFPDTFRPTSIRGSPYFSAVAGNTLEAFRAAGAEGVPFAEADFVLTADHVLVSSHDNQLPGSCGAADQHTWAELEKCDLGAGYSLARLEDFIAQPFQEAYLDLKSTDTTHDDQVRATVASAAAAVEAASRQGSVVLMMYRLLPDVTADLRSRGIRGGHKGYPPSARATLAMVRVAAEHGMEMLCVPLGTVTGPVLRESARMGIWHLAWTLDPVDVPLWRARAAGGLGGLIGPQYVELLRDVPDAYRRPE